MSPELQSRPAHDPNAEFALPDLRYFLKIVGRQWRGGVIAASVVAALGLGLAFKAKDVYKSSIVVMFDNKDSIDVNYLGELGPANPETIEFSFQNRLVSGDFLSELETKVVLYTEGRLSKLLRWMGVYGEETQAQREARLSQWFAKRLVPITNPGTGNLQINVLLDDTPGKAQELAAASMNLFVEQELKAMSSRLGVKIEFLTAAMQKAKERLVAIQRASGGRTKGPSVGDVATNAPVGLKQREAELLDQIRLAESEVNDLTAERVRRRSSLESDLQRLQSRLEAEHPEVEAKRREIDAFTRAASPAEQASRELAQLRRELWMVRSQMLYPGADTSTFMSSDERLEVTRLVSLSQKIDELGLEKASVDRQAANPEARTRFRTVRPATYEFAPFARKRMQAFLGAIVVALMVGVLFMVFREASNALARDDWRVSRMFGKTILAQLSRDGLRAYPEIGPKGADYLRATLVRPQSEHPLGPRTLLAYRRLELAIGKARQGRVLFFASSGASDVTRQFFLNFTNIFATDSASNVLVIDCQLADPLVPGPEGDDWIDAALGRIDWQSILVKADGEKRAFDVLPLRRPVSAERMAPLTRQEAAPLLARLTEAYDLVMVRSFPESQFIENGALGVLSSDTIVCVDAMNTTYAELSRTLAHLEGPSLRGLVMIGT